MDERMIDSEAVAEVLGAVVDDYLQRRSDGEHPDIEDYASQHPHLADVIRQSLRSLEMVGDSLPAGGTTAGDVALSGEKRLGDFRLIQEIGRGGMGVVYEAEQISMGRQVALKVLPFAALADGTALLRFRNEVRAAATLDHRNIVSVYSAGEERGVHYYAMQLVHGRSLASVIRKLARQRKENRPLDGDSINDVVPSPHDGAAELERGLASTKKMRTPARVQTLDGLNNANTTTPELAGMTKSRSQSFPIRTYYQGAAKLAIQAASALQHAHERGVLHRDIKPSNLILDSEGDLYVTDFGLARIEAEAGVTMTGDVLGTLRYMAPEQALAKRFVVDHRADVYSLGLSLYELLTLRPAFDELNRATLLRQVAFEEPTPPRRVERTIPAELETIVLKAIAKEPDERYDTAESFADDLRAFLDHRPIQAKPPTILQRCTKWCVRHQAISWSVVALLLLTTLGSAIGSALVWQEKGRTASALTAERGAKNAANVALANEAEAKREAQRQAELASESLYLAHIRQSQQYWQEGQIARLHDVLEQHVPVLGEPDRRHWE